MIKKATGTQVKISEELDEQLLDLIANGRPVIDEVTGDVMKTADGKEVRRMPSAADFNAVINRLKQCGVATIPNEKNAIGNIAKRLRLAGTMPAVDEEEDDAATRAA